MMTSRRLRNLDFGSKCEQGPCFTDVKTRCETQDDNAVG